MSKQNIRTDVLKLRAQSLVQAGHLMEARLLYSEYCRLHKRDAEAWFMLGAIHGQLGMFDDAVGCFQKAINIQPSAEACDNLGLALQHQGKIKEAISSHLRALRLKPDYVPAHFNLGNAYKEQGKLDAAIASYRKAIQLRPDFSDAIHNLGAALQRLQRHEEALSCFQEAARLNPSRAEIHNSVGLAFLRLNDPTLAIDAFKEAIRLNPAYAEAWSNYGDTLLAQEKFEHALAVYQQALRLRANNPDLLLQVGELLNYLGKDDYGVGCFRQALSLQPDSHECFIWLGKALTLHMKFDEATECFQQALRIMPGDAEAIAGLSVALERQGNAVKAYEALLPLIDEGNDHPMVAVAFAAVSSRAGRQKDAVALMERILEKAETRLVDSQQICFGLGKLYENLSEYDLAFQYYSRANEIIQHDYATADQVCYVDKLISTYSASFMAGAPRASIRSDNRPIFIIGMPRSGTSLVEQILASHPEIYAAGELGDMFKIAAALSPSHGADSAHLIHTISQEVLNTQAGLYLDHLAKLADGARQVTDKMPTNFLLLGLIELLFPDAKIIHCIRNPLDTCLSCYFQDFSGRHTYSTKLEYLGAYYRQYERLMAHWKTVITLPILEIHYEDLVDDQQAWSQALIKFCGLEWDPQCLRFHESNRIINTASYSQVRRPMYKSSVGRWKHYQQHLGALLNALKNDKD